MPYCQIRLHYVDLECVHYLLNRLENDVNWYHLLAVWLAPLRSFLVQKCLNAVVISLSPTGKEIISFFHGKMMEQACLKSPCNM